MITQLFRTHNQPITLLNTSNSMDLKILYQTQLYLVNAKSRPCQFEKQLKLNVF